MGTRQTLMEDLVQRTHNRCPCEDPAPLGIQRADCLGHLGPGIAYIVAFIQDDALRCGKARHGEPLKASQPAHDLTFHETWNKLPWVFLFFLAEPSSPTDVAEASACSFVTVWYVVITTSYFFKSSVFMARVAP